LVLPFWYRLTWVVPEKGPLNGCVCSCDEKKQSAASVNDIVPKRGRDEFDITNMVYPLNPNDMSPTLHVEKFQAEVDSHVQGAYK